jgi:hypothetical protein
MLMVLLVQILYSVQLHLLVVVMVRMRVKIPAMVVRVVVHREPKKLRVLVHQVKDTTEVCVDITVQVLAVVAVQVIPAKELLAIREVVEV